MTLNTLLYDIDTYVDFTEVKVVFNIDDLTIHSTLHIFVQQSLVNLQKSSTENFNKLTCQYELLQLVVARLFMMIILKKLTSL